MTGKMYLTCARCENTTFIIYNVIDLNNTTFKIYNVTNSNKRTKQIDYIMSNMLDQNRFNTTIICTKCGMRNSTIGRFKHD